MRRRVLWLIMGLGPGGAERLLVSAAASHDRSRYEFDVAYLLAWKQHLVEPLRAEGVSSQCLGVDRVLDLRWIPRLRRLLRDGDYDIVHAHSPLPAAAARMLAWTIPRRKRPRLLSTEHNVWSSYALMTRIANAVTYPLEQAHLAVSEPTRASVWRPLRSRVETLVHGTNVADAQAAQSDGVRDAVRAELGIGPDELLACTVANLRAQKGYQDLLRVAERINERAIPVRFVAVGQGPLEEELHAAHARLGLGDHFRFLGYRADVFSILAASDLFVLASHYEGYPVAVMEALAAGVPVVATSVGGIPEAVRHGVEGLVVPPHHPDELADAVAALATDHPRREAMALAARRRGESFDIGRTVERIEALYDELLMTR